MTYYSKCDIAHKFFYSDGGYFYPSYIACGYDGDKFLSYATCIGWLTTDANGDSVLLYSNENMSITTGKHISALRSAAPCKCQPVFMEYGDNGRFLTVEKLAKRALARAEHAAGLKMTLAANRSEFLTAYNILTALKDLFKIRVKIPVKMSRLAETLNDSEALKALKARTMEKARKEAAARAAKLKRLLKNNKLSELARVAYDYDANTDAATRAEIKKVINPDDDLAFVWYDAAADVFKSSKYIRMDGAEGRAALKLWAEGRLHHGLKVGIYTVLEVMSDYVRIGCHKIPTRNLSELAACIGLN